MMILSSLCFNQNSICPFAEFPFIQFFFFFSFLILTLVLKKSSRGQEKVEFHSPDPGGSSPFCSPCSPSTFCRSWTGRFCSTEDSLSACASPSQGEALNVCVSPEWEGLLNTGEMWFQSSTRHLVRQQMLTCSVGVAATYRIDEYPADLAGGHIASNRKTQMPSCVQCELSEQCAGDHSTPPEKAPSSLERSGVLPGAFMCALWFVSTRQNGSAVRGDLQREGRATPQTW